MALNAKARVPSYLLSLDVGSDLLLEHKTLHKKPHYTSSAQLTTQHSIEDLQNKLLLTVINFARKQIGPKMSDCLVTGVQPFGPEVTQDTKRDATICVQPFDLFESRFTSVKGDRVGVLPREMGIVTSNPRDLSWEEFVSINIVVGQVISWEKAESPADAPEGWGLYRFIIDIGKLHGGQGKGAAWFKTPDESGEESALQRTIGRRILVVTNIAPSDDKIPADPTEAPFLDGTMAIMTAGGTALLEPAKEVEIGYRLA